MTITPAVEARGLVKVFDEGGSQVRALDGVDLVVQQRALAGGRSRDCVASTSASSSSSSTCSDR
jgi:hypothetical protein